MRAASAVSTTPRRLACTHTPLSRASWPSRPVPTIGAMVRTSGTAWRCMFAPMSARFASSCSRNGIIAAATLTSWNGEMSISVIWSAGTILNSPSMRAETRFSVRRPFSSCAADAWAMCCFSSWRAENHTAV